MTVKCVTDGLFDPTVEWGGELGGFLEASPVHPVLHVCHFYGLCNSGSLLRTHISSGPMQCLNHKPNPMLFTLLQVPFTLLQIKASYLIL